MMKVAVVLLCALAAVHAASPFDRLRNAATAQTLKITHGPTTRVVDGMTPPKDTPLPFTVCSGAPTDLNINTVYLTPNPPVKGGNIGIQAIGNVDEQLTTGANFVISVTYMGVNIFSETVDLSKAVNLPVGPGAITLNYSVLIPSIAPSGAYVVSLTFNDQTGTEITCVSVALTL